LFLGVHEKYEQRDPKFIGIKLQDKNVVRTRKESVEHPTQK